MSYASNLWVYSLNIHLLKDKFDSVVKEANFNKKMLDELMIII